MLARTLLAATLILGLMACSGSDAATAVASPISRTIGGTPTATAPIGPTPPTLSIQRVTPVSSPTPPLPSGCDEATILGVVRDFIDAFNRGDQTALTRVFPAKGSDGDHPWNGDFNQLRWFTLVRANPSKGVDALNLYTSETLLAYFAERHAQREQMSVVELIVNRGASGPGAAAINFRVARVADDLPMSIFSGKGGVSCQHGVIFLWSQ